eukprot:SAG11_NODE_32507_length_283_cov_0.565217_1_plen_22_part_01
MVVRSCIRDTTLYGRRPYLDPC